MIRRALPVLFACALLGHARAQDDLFPDEPEVFELRHGTTKPFLYIAEVDGEASIWVRSVPLDVTLEVLDGEGNRLAFDDDSGGNSAGHIFLDVVEEQEYRIVVAAKPTDGDVGTGEVRACIVETAVDERIRELMKRLMKSPVRINESVAAGKPAEALASARADLEAMQTVAVPWPSGLRTVAVRIGTTVHGYDRSLAAEILNAVLISDEVTLPPEHPDLLSSRSNIALRLIELGQLEAARTMLEKVLEVLPEDSPAYFPVVLNHGIVIRNLGDFERAASIFRGGIAALESGDRKSGVVLKKFRKNLAVAFHELELYRDASAILETIAKECEESLPDDAVELQWARADLADALFFLQDYERASELMGQALGVLTAKLPENSTRLSRVQHQQSLTLELLGRHDDALIQAERAQAGADRLPPGHPDRLLYRDQLAVLCWKTGRLDRARSIYEGIIKEALEHLSEDSRAVLSSRHGIAQVLHAQRRLEESAKAYEEVIAQHIRVLGDEHRDTLAARINYANVLMDSQDLEGAMRHQQRAIAVMERTRSEDDLELLAARNNYATLLEFLGDHRAAAAMLEEVVTMLERVLDDDAAAIREARHNHAIVLMSLGETDHALELDARVLEHLRKSPDDPKLLDVLGDHALMLKEAGRFDEAAAIEKDLLARRRVDLPEGHPDICLCANNYAMTLEALGDLEEAARLLEGVLATTDSTWKPGRLHRVTVNLNLIGPLWKMLSASPDDVGPRLRRSLERAVEEAGLGAESTLLSLSARQVEARGRLFRAVLSIALSARSTVDLDAEALLQLAEALRSSSLRARRLARITLADETPEIRDLRTALRMATHGLEVFSATPSGPGASATSRLAGLARKKESVETAYKEALAGSPEAHQLLRRISVAEIAEALADDTLAISFVNYERFELEASKLEDHVVAMILSPDGEIRCTEIGAAHRLHRAIEGWRLGLDERGPILEGASHRLAKLLGPVFSQIGDDVEKIVVALSDELHLVPLAALPLESGELVGDRFEICVVSGLESLVRERELPPHPPSLSAFGHPSFSAPRGQGGPAEKAVAERFRDLTGTGEEVADLARMFRSAFPEAPRPKVHTRSSCDKPTLLRSAPESRFLHVATHGWFAPESVPSVLDEVGFEGTSFTSFRNLRDEVRGYLPLRLCGLALAGANGQRREDGSHPGLLYGTEIADLDLSAVELAVLSACETNVGVTRSGQGIMSLQEALATAGVHYSLTSLWNVPDEATMKLMARFYDGIWRRNETKRDALWQAKLALRNAKDPRTGKPRYGVKDWAGWVLYGNPE